MPHLSPMNWLILMLSSWLFLLTLMTLLFFSPNLPFSGPKLSSKTLLYKSWLWS